VNQTRFPKEDHLPYWASGQQSYEEWSCRTTLHRATLCSGCSSRFLQA